MSEPLVLLCVCTCVCARLHMPKETRGMRFPVSSSTGGELPDMSVETELRASATAIHALDY